MAALGQRGHWKLSLPACPQILFGRIRNKLVSLNGANCSNLWPESTSCGIYSWNNRTLSSLPTHSFVLQKHNHFGSPFSTCLQIIPTRNKTSFTSIFLPTVSKNNQSSRSPLAQLLNTSSLLLPHKISSFDILCRFKQKKKNPKLQEEEEETFSEDEADDLEDKEFEEETNLPLNYKQLTVHVKSARADALLSTGLNISRAKIDSMFYASKLLHNDKPLTKKSKTLNDGDYVDLIMEGGEAVKVKRIKVLKISSEKSRTDKISIVLRAWRSPFSLESLNEES